MASPHGTMEFARYKILLTEAVFIRGIIATAKVGLPLLQKARH